jgi:hypothetical protein
VSNTLRQQGVPFLTTVHYHSTINSELGPEKEEDLVDVVRGAQTSFGRRVPCLGIQQAAHLPFCTTLFGTAALPSSPLCSPLPHLTVD